MKTPRKNRNLPLSLLLAAMLIIPAGCRKGDGKSSAIQAGKYTILDTRTDNTDRARAKQNAEDALTRYPDVDCLVGLWSYNGPAILSAVQDAKKIGKVKIVCFDEERDTLQGVLDGQIFGTIVQQPYEFGYQSVRILAALARGDKSVIPANKIMDVPVMVIRKDNVQAFWDNLDNLMKAEPLAKEPAEQKGEKLKIAYLTNNPSDFWKIARAGVEKAKVEFNVDCQFLMPPTGTAEEQQRMLESLIIKGITGVAMSPVDPANQTEIINKACARMNVITQDSDAPESNRICYVGTNNYQAGRQAGKLIKEALPDGGKLMIFVGMMDPQNAIDRRQGILDELNNKPTP